MILGKINTEKILQKKKISVIFDYLQKFIKLMLGFIFRDTQN